MSKQLATSAAFSVFAMAFFLVQATPNLGSGASGTSAQTQAGATTQAAAPASGRVTAALADLV